MQPQLSRIKISIIEDPRKIFRLGARTDYVQMLNTLVLIVYTLGIIGIEGQYAIL